MLTHQKTKPFVCMEQGCSKSYCDYRSLRRHYEVQHGLCILKEAPVEEEAGGDSPHTQEVAGPPAPSGLRSLTPPEARPPGALLPSRDLLRCIVSSLVHQKVPSPCPAPTGPADSSDGRNTACPCPPSSGSSSCTPASAPAARGALGPEVPEEPRPPQKEPVPEMFTAAHTRVAESGGPDPSESEPWLLQLPPTLEGWPEGGPLPACLPLFRSQTVPSGSQPPSHNFPWLRNRSQPGCPKSKGSNVFVVRKAPAVQSPEGPECGLGPSSTSPTREPSPGTGYNLEDVLPLTPSGDPRHAGEDDSWASKESKFDCDTLLWRKPGEPSLQETQKPGGLEASDATPLFRQLFLKSQEPLVSHEQMQVLQMITKSQCVFSHAQVAAASSQLPAPEGKQAALKSGPWPQQPLQLTPSADSVHSGLGSLELEGSPAQRRKTTAAFPRAASPGSMKWDSKGGPKGASAPPSLTMSSLDPPGNPDISLAKQLRPTQGTLDLGDIFSPGGPQQTQSGGEETPGAQGPGKQAQAENRMAPGTAKGEKGSACPRGGGHRPFSGNPRAQRFSGFRKEKVKLDMCCAASPSQVAMASFSSAGPLADPARDSKSKLTIFNRIQVLVVFSVIPGPRVHHRSVPGCSAPIETPHSHSSPAVSPPPPSQPLAATSHLRSLWIRLLPKSSRMVARLCSICVAAW